MNQEFEKGIENINDKEGLKVTELKPYSKPEFYKLGEVKKHTLGGSVGIGDSGFDPANEQPFS